MTADVSAFGGGVVGVLLKGKTGGSATFKASINGVSALSGSYTTSSGSYYSDKIAPQQDGKVSLTFQGSSKAFYVESVTVFVAKPSAHADANALAGTVGDGGFVEITAENFKGSVSYSWTSDDESIASIDPDCINAANTMVYFNKKGQTELHCTVTDGTDTVVVNIAVSVGEKATDISLSKSELTLTKGESSILTATLLPEGAVGVVEWSSSNPSVATVADGKVSAKGIGEAVITAKCGELSKTCKVTVNPIHGTVITDPYSPDEAVSHMDDMQKNASETYFVKGVCSKIAYAYDGKSMSIFVGKDSSSKTFEFYRMKVTENPHISIGDIVVASSLGGNATTYNGTYEFKTCTFVSVEYSGLNAFVETYMHMDAKVDSKGMTGEMSCLNWYADAKAAYNALNSDQKAVFQTNAYEAARLRLANWAKANGDTLSESGISSINRSAIRELNSDSNTAFIVTALGIGGVVAAIGYFLTRKKKHN